VDDDQVDRITVRRHLARSGLRADVAEAEGVLEAIEKLTTEHFDCVLLDFNLPDGDGLTFLRGLRNAGVSVPVVMLTGQLDPGIAVSLMLAGAADYIPKDALSARRLRESVGAALTREKRWDS
jgi:DNA-binding response OmpR family regulator